MPVLACSFGCVLPYPDLNEEPPYVNSMPVILPESIVPQLTRDPVEADVGPGCQHRTFSATAIDYDGADVLHYKWILTATVQSGGDPIGRTFELVESSVPASDVPVDTILPGLSESAPSTRTYKDLSLDLTRERLLSFVDIDALLPPPNVGGTYSHLLQLWVSDRSFEPGVANVTPVTPEGEAPQPAESVSWHLTIENTLDCKVEAP